MEVGEAEAEVTLGGLEASAGSRSREGAGRRTRKEIAINHFRKDEECNDGGRRKKGPRKKRARKRRCERFNNEEDKEWMLL
eukprot:11315016-Ditylum_brightwellii.AAC.1